MSSFFFLMKASLSSDEGLGNNSDKESTSLHVCERKTNTRSPALSDNSNLYSWCVYYQEGYNGHNSVNIKILYFPAFTSFNLDNIQVNLDKKVMQLLSIKGERKGRKICIFSSIGF